MRIRDLLKTVETIATAGTARGATSFSAVHTHAPSEKYPNGYKEDLGVIAFDHPSRWRVWAWKTSRRLRRLPIGQINREAPK